MKIFKKEKEKAKSPYSTITNDKTKNLKQWVTNYWPALWERPRDPLPGGIYGFRWSRRRRIRSCSIPDFQIVGRGTLYFDSSPQNAGQMSQCTRTWQRTASIDRNRPDTIKVLQLSPNLILNAFWDSLNWLTIDGTSRSARSRDIHQVQYSGNTERRSCTLQ